MTDGINNWRIVPGTLDFNLLRTDPAFGALLDLGRALNALRFCQFAYLAAAGDERPSARRQRLNAFLFNCAALYEALAVVDRLGRHYREHHAYEPFFRLQRDRRFRRFREQVLNRIRTKVTFHFDADVTPQVLRTLDLEEYAFIVSTGRGSGEVYYDLADTIAVNYILAGIEPAPTEESAAVLSLVQDATDLTIAVMVAGEHLIAHVLRENGWRLEGAPDNAEDGEPPA